MKIIHITKDQKLSLKRSIDAGTEEQRKIVKEIIERVKKEGDQALYEYTKRFDGVDLQSLRVSKEEISRAYEAVDKEFIDIVQEAADRKSVV